MTEVKNVIMVQWRKRFWVFGEANELTGMRPLMAPPAPPGIIDQAEAISHFMKHHRMKVVHVASFLAVKNPTNTYMEVILEVERRASAVRIESPKREGSFSGRVTSPRPTFEEVGPGETVIGEDGTVIDG